MICSHFPQENGDWAQASEFGRVLDRYDSAEQMADTLSHVIRSRERMAANMRAAWTVDAATLGPQTAAERGADLVTLVMREGRDNSLQVKSVCFLLFLM